MHTFLLDGYELDPSADENQGLLAKAHGSKSRLLCMCTRPPQEMYVAKVGQRFYVKRMPNTGSRHAPGCESYEPPAELSGLGDLIGGAITEDVSDGSTTLRLGFSLSKVGGRAAPVSSGAETDTVKTDGKKLTLRATLHYLWDQAGFNRWSPAMTGKRSWGVVHKHLVHAAEGKTAKGDALADVLFIPEPFYLQDKDGIERRRLAKIAPLRVQAKGAKRLMIVVGEVKAIEPSRYGHKVVVKHLADMPFMVADDLHKRMAKRFADELELWNSIESAHLVMVGTFGLGPTGVASLEEMALMVVTQEWLPIENVFELDLLASLVDQQRHFIKGMRYNLASSRPLATAVLQDTQPKSAALYVIPPTAEADYGAALHDLVASSELASWFWRAGEEPCPPLPAHEGFEAMPVPQIGEQQTDYDTEAEETETESE